MTGDREQPEREQQRDGNDVVADESETTMKSTNLWRLLALLAAFGLIAAACGSDDDGESADTTVAEVTDSDTDTDTDTGDETDDAGDDTADDAGDATGAPETTELTLGLIPIADVAPVFIAIERGFFEEEGLTITTEFAAGGAAAIPALQAGDIDLAFGGYPSTLKAIEAGVPLVITQEAVRGEDGFGGLYALPDSGIAEPADLAGTTIAVNTLNNIVQMTVQITLQNAGLTLDDVTLVEIPFPEMTAALDTESVDVVALVEPFGTIAASTLDAVFVADLLGGDLSGFPVAGWQVTQEFADANPNTIAAFNRAFAKGTEIAANEDGALAAIVPTYTSAPPELAAVLNYPAMVSGIDLDAIQQVADVMLEQGLLDGPIDAADIVLN